MSNANRVYISSKDRTLASDLPSQFTVNLLYPLQGRDIYKLGLSHLSLEFLPQEPTFPNNSGRFEMNVTGIGAVNWTMDRSILSSNTSELTTNLNSAYQTASSTGDSPFSFDSTTNLITVTLSSDFTIDPTAANSGWQQIGYSEGDLTDAALVGANYEITFSSSPNLSRTSVIYLLLDVINDATGSSRSVTREALASIPVAGTQFAVILNYNPVHDASVLDFDEEISSIRVRLLDDDYNDLRLQLNALVAMELQLEQKVVDSNRNGIPDNQEDIRAVPVLHPGDSF